MPPAKVYTWMAPSYDEGVQPLEKAPQNFPTFTQTGFRVQGFSCLLWGFGFTGCGAEGVGCWFLDVAKSQFGILLISVYFRLFELPIYS